MLFCMRHGESLWNRENRFTGWVDIPLSPRGIDQALAAGPFFQGKQIDVVFTSTLVRAQQTLFLALAQYPQVPRFVEASCDEHKEWTERGDIEGTLPVYRAWQLNERMYGDLQGLNKELMREKYGKEQVETWRRSCAVRPPRGESLELCIERVVPYFEQAIIPYLQAGKGVFICAHGNSLRALLMYLKKLTPQEVVALEIPLGEPFSVPFDLS